MATWEQREDESKKAFAAFTAYCEMGAGRSIRKLHARFLDMASEGRGQSPPTKQLSTLFTWSSRHDWPARADAWDTHQRAERQRHREAARRQVEDEGLAHADVLLAEWQRALEEAKARATAIALEAGARVDGQPTVLVMVDAGSVQRLTRARLEIEKLRRRALGMAERVTQAQAEKALDALGEAEVVPDLSHLSVDELLALVDVLGEDGQGEDGS